MAPDPSKFLTAYVLHCQMENYIPRAANRRHLEVQTQKTRDENRCQHMSAPTLYPCFKRLRHWSKEQHWGTKQNGATENQHIPTQAGPCYLTPFHRWRHWGRSISEKTLQCTCHLGSSSPYSPARSLHSQHTENTLIVLCQYYHTFVRSILITMRSIKTHPTGQPTTQIQQCPHKLILAQTHLSPRSGGYMWFTNPYKTDVFVASQSRKKNAQML